MTLETYYKAEKAVKLIANYKESIEYCNILLKNEQRTDIFSRFGINYPIGFGSQIIKIPPEIVPEVVGTIKKHLEKKVEQLKQQFNEL